MPTGPSRVEIDLLSGQSSSNGEDHKGKQSGIYYICQQDESEDSPEVRHIGSDAFIIMKIFVAAQSGNLPATNNTVLL